MKHLGRATLVALAVFSVSCARPAAPNLPTQAPSPAGETGLADCPQIDLRSPAGNPVNLTETWYGSDSTVVYYLTQKGSCLWWAGGFATSETSPGFVFGGLGGYTSVFAGHMSTDFTVEGTWVTVRARGSLIDAGQSGTMVLEIEFAGEGEEETVQLTQLGQPTEDRQQAHPDSRWTRISNVDIPPP